MNTFEINDILTKNPITKKIFCGVFAIDYLPKERIKRLCAFVVNTEESTKNKIALVCNICSKNFLTRLVSNHRIKKYIISLKRTANNGFTIQYEFRAMNQILVDYFVLKSLALKSRMSLRNLTFLFNYI
jgi:hypothetical protein